MFRTKQANLASDTDPFSKPTRGKQPRPAKSGDKKPKMGGGRVTAAKKVGRTLGREAADVAGTAWTKGNGK